MRSVCRGSRSVAVWWEVHPSPRETRPRFSFFVLVWSLTSWIILGPFISERNGWMR